MEFSYKLLEKFPGAMIVLKTSRHPVGVAEYKLTNRLPKKKQAELPTPKELREHLR